jgi:hypothetical protein
MLMAQELICKSFVCRAFGLNQLEQNSSACVFGEEAVAAAVDLKLIKHKQILDLQQAEVVLEFNIGQLPIFYQIKFI